jgi:hypothetical protein
MRLIDADALYTEMVKQKAFGMLTAKSALRAVANSLTIESERKKGNWIWKNKKAFCSGDCWYPPIGFEDTWNEKEGSWIEKELFCSECNYENGRHYKSNFCPKCGADMRGEQDDR